MVKVMMESWREGLQKVALTKLQHEKLGLSLSESKRNVDMLLDDQIIILEIEDENITIVDASSDMMVIDISTSKNNYKIVLCGRRQDRLQEVEKELSAFTEVHSLQFDVRDKEAVAEKIKALPAAFSSIDVLINNAGAFIEKSKNDEIHDMIILNSLSPYFISTNSFFEATTFLAIFRLKLSSKFIS